MFSRVMHVYINQLRPPQHQASECTVPPTVPQSLEPENLTHSYLQTYGLLFSSMQAALLWYRLTVQLSSWGDDGVGEANKNCWGWGAQLSPYLVSEWGLKKRAWGALRGVGLGSKENVVEERPTATCDTTMEVHGRLSCLENVITWQTV